ncbi:hypothetical protein YC2023_059515 [Brassica napus]
MLKELYSLHNVIISLQAIEALDPNHKLGTGTTRIKLNLNRKKLHIIKLFREFNQRKNLQSKFDVIKAQRATLRQQDLFCNNFFGWGCVGTILSHLSCSWLEVGIMLLSGNTHYLRPSVAGGKKNPSLSIIFSRRTYI